MSRETKKTDVTWIGELPENWTATPIKRKLKSDEFFYNDHGTMRIGKYKNEQVSSDVRTEKQRKSDQSWADKKKKQMRM